MKKLLILFGAAALISCFFLSCAEPDIPQGWALIYGVESYPPGYTLNYCVDDAEALNELLTDQGWNVRLRTDSEADLAALTSDIEYLKQNMSANDRFLFYFSGHGVYLSLDGSEADDNDTDDEVIVLSGALNTVLEYLRGDTSADVLGVTVSDDSLAELLSSLPTPNKTVIIDACYSGGFIGDGYVFNNISPDYTLYETSAAFAPIESMKLYIGYTATGNDLPPGEFTILTASGGGEESYETSELGHGVFSYFLLQSPNYADRNLDGYISLTEAWSYISASIDNYWNSSAFVSRDEQFMTNVSAFPVDPVLFKSF